jgi:hypothetical protein
MLLDLAQERGITEVSGENDKLLLKSSAMVY